MADELIKKTSVWPFAIFGGLLVALGFLNHKYGSQAIHPQKPANDPTNRTPRQIPVVAEILPSQWSKNGTPFWKKCAEIGIAIGTVGLLIVNACQIRITRESNIIAKNAFQSAQRAFIVHKWIDDPITTVVTNPRGKDTIALEFITRWENAGNTPAVGVLTIVGAVEQDHELTEQEFVGVPMVQIMPKTMSALGPKESTGSQTIHETQDFATDNPTVPRFFWGWMIYRDIFPKTKVHITEFCWKATKIERLDDGQYYFDGTNCLQHNCVDEFCEDYSSIIGLAPPAQQKLAR